MYEISRSEQVRPNSCGSSLYICIIYTFFSLLKIFIFESVINYLNDLISFESAEPMKGTVESLKRSTLNPANNKLEMIFLSIKMLRVFGTNHSSHFKVLCISDKRFTENYQSMGPHVAHNVSLLECVSKPCFDIK